MSGCDYLMKSFTVVMNSEKKDICEECKREITENTLYKKNKRKLCRKCFDK